MQQQSFFNTISLSGSELQEAKDTCNKQEQKVLDLMKRNMPYTPFQVHSLYCSQHDPAPLTSVRRAMTCLTDKGRLIKLDVMRKEVYGKKNYCWMKP